MILYPFVGTGRFASAQAVTWNGSRFHLAPVRVTRQERLGDALPAIEHVGETEGATPGLRELVVA